MKHSIYSLIFTVILIISSNSMADRPLSSNTGVINFIDQQNYQLVINDRRVSVDKDVKVHSEFVNDDYFSRLKAGMQIKFKIEKINNRPTISEIWVQ